MKKINVLLTALVVLSMLLPSCSPQTSDSQNDHSSGIPADDSAVPPQDSAVQPDQSQDKDETEKPDDTEKPDENEDPVENETPDQTEKPDEAAAMKKLSYYKEDLLSRYIAYKQNNPTFSDAKVVTHVNIGLDRPYYDEETITPATDLGTNLVLANKYNYLSSDYEPTDLVSLASDTTTRSIKLCEEAARAFEQLSRDAKKAGYTILGMSGYRSYSYQKNLYERYLKEDPQSVVDTYSARAGHSEHQTGLAIDVQDNTKSYNRFGETAAYRWAVDNIHLYGFVIHYTADNEFVTGYKNEPWHFRYVGVDVAIQLYHHNKNNPDDILSIDEFIAREMSEPYTLKTDIT